MSITVAFSMEPKKKWFSGNTWDRETAERFAKDLAREEGYRCDIVQHYMIFQFCPEGFLWMSWNDGKIIGDCQTNVAGPGFHAAVIYFLELFAARGQLELYVEDSTGFYGHRDFKRMRQEYFYQWFRELMEAALRNGDKDREQLLCWPSDYYLPEERKGTVMTHIRRFTLEEVGRMVNSGISMGFARDFFIWNEEEKDSYYYRNCGLVMMNQECYFMPSSRSQEDEAVNGRIIDLLEKAWELNHGIPLPKEEYLELCRLHGKEPINPDKIAPMHLAEQVGCRRGLLYRTIGNARFAVPGSFLYDTRAAGHSERYFDGLKDGWHDYYICAMTTQSRADFKEEPFQKNNILKTLEFKAGKGRGKIAVYHPAEKEGKKIYTVAAQVIFEHQITIISISADKPEGQEWALDLVKRVETIPEM